MKHRRTKMLAVLLVGAWVSAACLAKPPTKACRAHAQAALTAFVHGHGKQMNQYLAPVVTSRVTPAKWQQIWTRTTKQFGAFQGMGPLAPHVIHGHDFLIARMGFADSSRAIVVACDDKDRITTFRLVPAGMVPGLVKSTPVSMPPGARSVDIKVSTPLGPLPGKLVLPGGAGPFPAVVLVQGSGSTDYDETIGPNKPFRDIAMGLAKNGVASLRYDKRSYVYGKEMMGKPFTIDDNVTDDALTAVHLLAKHKHVDPHRVFVLGHSLGAMMAPRIGKRDPQLAGIIMMAAPARSLLAVLAWQFRELGKLSGDGKQQIAKKEKALAAERKLLDHADPARPPQGMYFHAPQSFWMSLHRYHQVAVAKKLDMPILVLQGEGDLNVSYKIDFKRWEKALAGHPNVTFHAYPGLSHLFMPAKKTAAAVDFTPGHVSPGVIHDIATWIKAQPPRD